MYSSLYVHVLSMCVRKRCVYMRMQDLPSAVEMREQVGMAQLWLKQRRSANMVCIKLISPEDRMQVSVWVWVLSEGLG